ncbi:hypothetical protein ACFCW2_01305 [Qipengyuania sp. DSG2-2]|uniref:hypothetical protein n=1 Tax=Qipengyuania sp. DGS2-2 TaxID=3349631 RepID=UPI0036D37C90
MLEFFHGLIFASDAALVALAGGAFLVLAVVALLAERWRNARVRIDRIGWVPWTGVFLFSAVIGAGLLALAIPALLKGG